MTDDEYRRAGVTHWTLLPNQPETLLLVACPLNDKLQRDCTCECAEANDGCDTFTLYTPYNVEGGPGPICWYHMWKLGWTTPTLIQNSGALCAWPY